MREAVKMVRKIALLMLVISGLSGCKGFDRPRDLRKMEKPDQPEFSIDEQQRRSRAKYAIPEDDSRVAPRGFIDRPSPTGR
jgi:hypothetical protein